MPDFLRDPAWQFIGVLLSAIAIAVTVKVALAQRTKRRLVYRYTYAGPVVSVDESVRGRVEILFDDVPVRDVRLFVLTIKNAGNVPIPTSSFERPVMLRFGSGRVLSASVSEQHPADLGAAITAEEQHIELKPLLLNPSDFLTLRILAEGIATVPFPEARIEGVRMIAVEEDPLDWWDLVGFPMMVVANIAAWFVDLSGDLIRSSPPLRAQYLVLCGISAGVAVASVSAWLRAWRRALPRLFD